MPDRADLAALLTDPTRAAEVPSEQVPRLLCQLAALQTVLAARLATVPGAVPRTDDGQGGDRLLTAREVHARTTLSVAWVYRHADALPFCRRVGRKVLFSEAGLTTWLATRRP
jgi:predicted DNA-binding transcriptional regulator AlpA